MILLPFIIFFIYYIYYQKNNKVFGIINLLFITYLVSLGLGAVNNLLGIHPNVLDIHIFPMVYLSITLLIIFRGFTIFRDNKFIIFKIENYYFFQLLEYFVLFAGLLSIAFYLPFSIIALTGDINFNRINNSDLIAVFGQFGLINSFAALFANIFCLSQTFFFLRLINTKNKKSRFITYLMLFSSLSYIFYNLAFVGRDGVILWSMTFFFQFLFFKKFISGNKLKKIKRLGLILLFTISVPFLIISTSRFGSTDQGTVWYLLNYLYQQPGNFNDHFQIESPLQYGRINFSVFTNFLENLALNTHKEIDKSKFEKYFLDEGVMPNTFSFWIGGIIRDFGKIGSLIFLICFSFITRKSLVKLKRTGIFYFSDYIIFILLYQIVYYGVFYFRYFSANFYILFIILLWVLLKLFRSTNTYIFKKL